MIFLNRNDRKKNIRGLNKMADILQMIIDIRFLQNEFYFDQTISLTDVLKDTLNDKS